MSIRIRFVLNSITQVKGKLSAMTPDNRKEYVPGVVHNLQFVPTYHEDKLEHENYKLWAAGSQGVLQLNLMNPASIQGLEAGKEYFIDITPVEDHVEKKS